MIVNNFIIIRNTVHLINIFLFIFALIQSGRNKKKWRNLNSLLNGIGRPKNRMELFLINRLDKIHWYITFLLPTITMCYKPMVMGLIFYDIPWYLNQPNCLSETNSKTLTNHNTCIIQIYFLEKMVSKISQNTTRFSVGFFLFHFLFRLYD